MSINTLLSVVCFVGLFVWEMTNTVEYDFVVYKLALKQIWIAWLSMVQNAP